MHYIYIYIHICILYIHIHIHINGLSENQVPLNMLLPHHFSLFHGHYVVLVSPGYVLFYPHEFLLQLWPEIPVKSQ